MAQGHLHPVPTPVVSCGWLAPPSNGLKEGSKYLMGSTVYFHCNNGYSLEGAEVSTCQADGTWSYPTPTCQPGEMACFSCPWTLLPGPAHALAPPIYLLSPGPPQSHGPCPGLPSPLAPSPGRSHTVLLSIIFGGLAVVVLAALLYVLLRRRKRNT